MIYNLEMTDTFAGESNYSWVRRDKIEMSEYAKQRSMVRAAKKWAGWTGHRCNVTDYGDMIEIRPVGMCQVLFVSREYE